MQLEKNVELLSVEAVRTFEEWKRLLRASDEIRKLVDNYAGYATKTTLNDATLYQLEGSLNGVEGRFEWIIQDGKVTHRMFIQNGAMNGVPIKP